jgi:uncharacterized 2Fe-2S/4Fe-4S cluster protein (DUF4445 family)
MKEKKSIKVSENTTILEAMRMAGLSPDAPCGGQGKCGKCLVDVIFSETADSDTTVREEDWETVKACNTMIERSCRVRTRSTGERHRILTSGTEHEPDNDNGKELSPVLEICEIVIPKCKNGESISDWNRLCEAIRQKIGEDRKFRPVPELASRLSAFVKAEEAVEAVILEDRILDVRKAENKPVLMAAFDIGTTSVAGYLLDGRSGEQLAAAGCLNPQTAYGADVIMRADYALERGVGELSDCIRECLNELLTQLCSKAGTSKEDIFEICVVGNTCMHHLFLGIVPDALVHAPYNPAISEVLFLEAAAYGITAHPRAGLIMLPVIAGFVGADTVGCLLAADMDKEEKMTLMIDIGTNGEIVLGNKYRRIACSTAAGPALEGAKISCGMRGAEGAIEHVKVQEEGLQYSVIGQGKPAGLCGSGLIDLTAALLDTGILDESGRMNESENIVSVDGKPAYLLADEQQGRDGRQVCLTQKDVRELQLAKGAIAAGIQLLAVQMGITIKDIEQVWIAGAFGNYMNPQSACRIGLLPQELGDRIIPIGNAAGEGAKRALLCRDAITRARYLAENTEFLELASLSEFQDCFVDELEFPERIKE